MKTLKISILAILISCLSSQDNSEYLFGVWNCYHKELENGTTKSFDAFNGKEYEYSCSGMTFRLNSDFTGIDDIGLKFEYHKRDSILYLGNRSFIIEELNKTHLVLRDYDSKKTNITIFRLKFNKID